jgi:ribonuclease D
MAKLRRVSLDRSTARSAVEAIGAALTQPASELPRVEPLAKLPRGIGPLVDLLRVLLKFKSEEHHVAQRLVATTDDLEQIAAFDAPDVPSLKGWRREVFGDAALALKRGEIGLAVQRGRVQIVATDKLEAPA